MIEVNVSIAPPAYRDGDVIYVKGDATRRRIELIECNINVKPDGNIWVGDWAYHLSDPDGGYGPVHESDLTTFPPAAAKIKKGGGPQQKKRQGFVYLLREINGPHYKIGRTNNPSNRDRTFGIKLPYKVEYEAVIKTDDMYTLEAELRERFEDKQVNGEWFALSSDDVAYIKGLAGQVQT